MSLSPHRAPLLALLLCLLAPTVRGNAADIAAAKCAARTITAEKGVALTDMDPDPANSEVRLQFRSGPNDEIPALNAVHASTGTAFGTNIFGLFGSGGKGCPSLAGSSFSCSVDSDSQNITISKLGGYSAGSQLTIYGPGTLYIETLDLAEGDSLEIAHDPALPSYTWSGYYRPDCFEGDIVVKSKDPFCYEMLVGRFTPPKPMEIPAGAVLVTLNVNSHGRNAGFEGFDLKLQPDDYYYVDMTGTDTVRFEDGPVICDLTGMNTLTTGQMPTTQPVAWFYDTVIEPEEIGGPLYAEDSNADGFKVTLQLAYSNGTRIDVNEYDIQPSPVNITDFRLRNFLSPLVRYGAPADPFYQFEVRSCIGDNCNPRDPIVFTLIDRVDLEPGFTFTGDASPRSRRIDGTITMIVPYNSLGLQGYRFCPSDYGDECLSEAQYAINLGKSCPPDENNEDYLDHVAGNTAWKDLAEAECSSSSPLSPKCLGKSCNSDVIRVDDGSQGEYFIARVDSAYRKYGPRRRFAEDEYARIYLPTSGRLVVMGSDAGKSKYNSDDEDMDSRDKESLFRVDTPIPEQSMMLYTSPDDPNPQDLTFLRVNSVLFLNGRESVIIWKTGTDTRRYGWSLVFHPDYPFVDIGEDLLYDGSAGFRIIPVWGSKGADIVTTDNSTDSLGDAYESSTILTPSRVNIPFVETYDWIVPNTTCSPTTMHCPVPDTWAHINYTTPSLYPEPAEGSCLQQKSGSNSLWDCMHKADVLGRGWTANCGDAKSYFWFEKIACGSERTFYTERSLIQDFVQLSPMPEDIQMILDMYFTTKAPTISASGRVTPGLSVALEDHYTPIMPPKINCTCLSAMDAFSSLLSVVSQTPTPGAPVTLDPEILNTGESKMVATLRVYSDPTYSVVAVEGRVLPTTVSRFYIEASTKFTRNRITISECTAAHEEGALNAVDGAQMRTAFCDNSMFDVRPEIVPPGVTHMDRLSMKKFKFGGDVTHVWLQCKILACPQQPCGSCEEPDRRLQQVDATPADGELFPPPVNFRLSPGDRQVMVLPPITSNWQANPWVSKAVNFDSLKKERPATAQSDVVSTSTSVDTAQSDDASAGDSNPQKIIQIKSEMTLQATESWAIENQESLAASLRTTLQLGANERLVITKISAARRRLLRSSTDVEDEQRKLQGTPPTVKIEFIVEVADVSRASAANTVLTGLSEGNADVVQTFTRSVDDDLRARGRPAAQLSAAAVVFTPPVQQEVTLPPTTSAGSNAGMTYIPTAQSQPTDQEYVWTAGNNYQASQQQGTSSTAEEENPTKDSTEATQTNILFVCGLLLLTTLSGRRLGMSPFFFPSLVIVEDEGSGSRSKTGSGSRQSKEASRSSAEYANKVAHKDEFTEAPQSGGEVSIFG